MRRVYGMKVVRITRGDLLSCTGRNSGAGELGTTSSCSAEVSRSHTSRTNHPVKG